jgi:hypothetical protein
VPEEWHSFDPSIVPLHVKRGGRELKSSGKVRYCRRCQCYKPDRAHHDSSSDQCVLRMDHHCPWINNTVGHRNQKYFLLFVGYMTFCSVYIFGTSIPASVRVLQYLLYPMGPPSLPRILWAVNWLLADTVAGLFSVTLSMFLYFHVCLAAQNMTTIEFMEKKDKLKTVDQVHLYDLGVKENLIAVFGRQWYLWWLPVYTTPGDGVHFPNILDVD